MFGRKKKIAPEPTYFDIEDGDFVELTLRGYYERGSIHTLGYSFFDLPSDKRQTDPDVFVKRIEEN